MGELLTAVDGELYSGDPELLHREALRVMVGGMTAEHILERLTESVVVIAPADRSDVLLALVNANAAEGFPSLAGIIMNGGLLPHPAVAQLVAGLKPSLPILTTSLGTFDTASAADRTRGRMALGAHRKIDTAVALMEQHVDTDQLLSRLDVPRPSVTTPQMFEYQLIDWARRRRRHIVLPEGDDDRILRAAGRVLQRRIADLTILGDETQVRRRATELGVDLSAAEVLDPRSSDLAEQFAEEYARLRAHKGMTIERAREIMSDISYFGTMMVHLGIADGMVSGAAHTTAHTIRPSFEIVKTEPGVSTVSSIFLMCLSDRVLAYGDCAVVPDPTTEQLADIAISSAATAARFGIEPRIAMLSYSTGESGSGADVDKVRAATALVRERRPDLPVEGPIQYDAAIEPSVASAKLPGSEVAGRATVFIFPDLNTGNNTYKAVQRSAGAVAVGPVLQGLRKPVNDLSRGGADPGHREHGGDHRHPGAGGRRMSARTEGTVLVLNSGSSSIKFQLVHPGTGESVAHGLIERIGEPEGRVVFHHTTGTEEHVGPIEDHRAGLRIVLDWVERLGRPLREAGIIAVGHRLVHGGEVFHEPTLVDDDVVRTVEELSVLAPLHNPANVIGMEVAREELPDIPHVGVFDTAFFHALPAAAATYAIDRDVARAHGIRRYGFHGTSHQYVSERAARFLGRELSELNQIVLHLGNGASASAIAGGRPVDTSMGLTPLEGLVMGTRCGDIDPGVLLHLNRSAGMDVDTIDGLLNRRSGLKGLSGVNDFRALLRLVAEGSEDAKLAYDVYVHRLRKYLGAYLVELGGVDVVVFTGGVGENNVDVRRDALAGLERLGIVVDDARNVAPERGERRISVDTSQVEVLVIPTDEELAIARAAAALV